MDRSGNKRGSYWFIIIDTITQEDIYKAALLTYNLETDYYVISVHPTYTELHIHLKTKKRKYKSTIKKEINKLKLKATIGKGKMREIRETIWTKWYYDNRVIDKSIIPPPKTNNRQMTPEEQIIREQRIEEEKEIKKRYEIWLEEHKFDFFDE